MICTFCIKSAGVLYLFTVDVAAVTSTVCKSASFCLQCDATATLPDVLFSMYGYVVVNNVRQEHNTMAVLYPINTTY
jgi:hypothetical protein